MLTTDIDLNGSVDNQWIPIGAGPSSDSYKYFDGVFEYCIANVDVASTSVSAGIAAFGNPTVRYSANLGDINGKNGVGGIIGMNGHVESCYNMGNISAEDVVGGIAGRSTDVKNSYNVGGISYFESATHKGAIVGYKTSGSIVNCYYLEGCIAESNEYGEPKSAEFMRSQEFVNLLNSDLTIWKMDTENINNGYPIIDEDYLGVFDNFVENTDLVVLYPNPATDYMHIMGDVTSYEIYDIVGKCVRNEYRQNVSANLEEIDLNNLQSGIYMIRLFVQNGNFVTKKIVKK